MIQIFGFDAVSLVFSVTILVIIWKVLRNDEKAAFINKLPGPKAFPILGNIIEVLEPKEKLADNSMKRRKKFGPVFRLWLGMKPLVVFSRADEIEGVLKGSKHSQKSFSYEFLESWLGTGLLTAHGNKWATHRKLITPAFHFSVLQNFIEIFQENSAILVEKLKKKAETGEEFNVYPLITLCALDIICGKKVVPAVVSSASESHRSLQELKHLLVHYLETAMGTKVNAQAEEQNEYVQSVYKLSALMVHRTGRVWLHPTFLFKLSPSGREYYKHLKIVQDFVRNVIQTRKKIFKSEMANVKSDEGNKKLTFLDLLLKASSNETPTCLTDEELREEVDTFMFEGHDTTAAAMNWTLFLLGHHPEIQEKVFEEVKSIFEKKEDKLLSLADLAEMKLLERVIKESLRLFPSVFSIGRELEEDMVVGEYTIPKGVTIVIAIYTLHRDPTYYKNPEVFDPDRFLPENQAHRHPYAYIPFSAGPRNCIGQKFAMFEEKVVLSNLLYNYRFESVEKLEQFNRVPELILRPRPGIKVKIYKR